MDARIIRTRGDGHHVVGKSLNAVWADRVRPNHHAQVVALEERSQVVCSKVDDVVHLLRVTGIVVLEALLSLRFVRIAPEKVDYFLVGLCVTS